MLRKKSVKSQQVFIIPHIFECICNLILILGLEFVKNNSRMDHLDLIRVTTLKQNLLIPIKQNSVHQYLVVSKALMRKF